MSTERKPAHRVTVSPAEWDRRRRVVMDLHVEADTWADLDSAMESVLFRLSEATRSDRHPIDSTSAGYTTSWRMTADEDESVTGDSYRAKLKAWMEARRA